MFGKEIIYSISLAISRMKSWHQAENWRRSEAWKEQLQSRQNGLNKKRVKEGATNEERKSIVARRKVLSYGRKAAGEKARMNIRLDVVSPNTKRDVFSAYQRSWHPIKFVSRLISTPRSIDRGGLTDHSITAFSFEIICAHQMKQLAVTKLFKL